MCSLDLLSYKSEWCHLTKWKLEEPTEIFLTFDRLLFHIK